jgi:hypothetical protein
MYTHSTIINCLRGLIGFEQPYNDEVVTLDNDLSNSASGLYINNLHPLLTYENILACAEHFERTNVRAWSSTVNYQAGALSKSGALIYQALKPGINHAVNDDEYWKPTNLLSAYLRRVYDAASHKLFNTIFTQKKLHEVAKSILGSVQLFEGVGNLSGRITKNNRLVGLRIKLLNPDTVANILEIGLQLDTAQANVKVYLYHSQSNEPLHTFEINHTKSLTFQWHAVVAQLNNTAGYYYLVYKESELTGSAVRKEITFTSTPSCGSCSDAIINAQLYSKWHRYISIQPFYVNSYVGPGLWDESQEMYYKETNWGMNIRMAVQCDVSNILCTYKSVLTNPLSQQITVDLLNEMSFSLRDNQRQGKIAGLAAAALDNQENGRHGEVKKLTEAIRQYHLIFLASARCVYHVKAKEGALLACLEDDRPNGHICYSA